MTMRFLMLMIPAVCQGGKGARADADFTPPADALEKMMRFNEAPAKAGHPISPEGRQPLEKGSRRSFFKDMPGVTDGPFIESKQVLGGYWMTQFTHELYIYPLLDSRGRRP